MERTLSIIKPDAVSRNLIGKILTRFEDAGLKIVAGRIMQLTKQQASEFYAVHKDRPFFSELVSYMITGPVFVSCLEGKDAVALNRKLMGATDPKKADPGTIRADFSIDLTQNSVHGSDSVENAATEVRFFFPEL